MRIAIIHPSLKVKGGAENVVLWLAEELSSRGHSVDVITTDYDEGFYGPKIAKTFKIIELPMLGGYAMRPLKWIALGWRLRRRLEGYDLVNPHNFPAYIYAYFAKWFNPKVGPLVWFCEEPVRHFYRDVIDEHVLMALATDTVRTLARPPRIVRLRKLVEEEGLGKLLEKSKTYIRDRRDEIQRRPARYIDRRVVPKLDLTIANSEFIAGTVERIFGVKAIPCLLGLPLERFDTSQVTLTYDPFILTVSRLFYEKNIFNIIRAVKILVDEGRFPVKRWVIAGSGPLKDALHNFIEAQGVGDAVELAGFVTEERLSDLYASAGLVVYLSLDETYGLVFPEAGLYRKAVLGPDHGGPREIIQSGLTGEQVDPLDPRAIADAVAGLWSDPARLRRMGEANRRFVEERLNFPGFVDRFMAIVKDQVG